MSRHVLRLQAAVDVTLRAAERLRSSIIDDKALLALATTKSDVEWDKDLLRALDAFVQRFQQVHEHMTHRLYPAIYRLATVGDRPPPPTDLFRWAAEFGFLESGRVWVERTELRNRLTHEYPVDASDRAIDLQAAVEQSAAMLSELDLVLAHITDRNMLENGNV